MVLKSGVILLALRIRAFQTCYHINLIYTPLVLLTSQVAVEITAFRGPLVLGFTVDYEIFLAVFGG